MKLLVSFCNQAGIDVEQAPCCLAEVDINTRAVRPIRLNDVRIPQTHGATGLAFFEDDLLVMMQSQPGVLVRLSRRYDVKDVWQLSLVRDGHSLAIANGRIYAASTGTDSIIEFKPSSNRQRVFWRASMTETDSVHLNSLHWRGRSLYATAFGRKKGPLWQSADNGYLFNVTADQVVAGPIYQPHSICRLPESGNDELYFCESWRMALGRENGQRKVLSLGFTRGLAITSSDVFVGVSRGRPASRSTGAIVPNLDGARWANSTCGIVHCRHRNGDLDSTEIVHKIDLEPHGFEVYDILLLPR
jgi:hypothetical protein